MEFSSPFSQISRTTQLTEFAMSLLSMAFSNRKLLPETQSPECSPFCFSLCLSGCLDSAPVPALDADPFVLGDDGDDDHHPPYLNAFMVLMILIALSSLILIVNGIYAYILLSRIIRNRTGPTMDPINQGHGHHAHDPPSRDDRDHDRPMMMEHHIWYINTVGLQASVINSIAVCKYKKGDGIVEGTDCAVCLSEFEEDESLRLLPKCNHAFHLHCIDAWLGSHTNCPMCRAPILSDSHSNHSSRSPQFPSSSGNNSGSGVNPRDHDVEDEGGSLRALTSNVEEGSEESMPLRRTYSMNFVSGSGPILCPSNGRTADHFSGDGAEEGTSSSSSPRLLQRGLGCMRRSMSCTGKILPP